MNRPQPTPQESNPAARRPAPVHQLGYRSAGADLNVESPTSPIIRIFVTFVLVLLFVASVLAVGFLFLMATW